MGIAQCLPHCPFFLSVSFISRNIEKDHRRRRKKKQCLGHVFAIRFSLLARIGKSLYWHDWRELKSNGPPPLFSRPAAIATSFIPFSHFPPKPLYTTSFLYTYISKSAVCTHNIRIYRKGRRLVVLLICCWLVLTRRGEKKKIFGRGKESIVGNGEEEEGKKNQWRQENVSSARLSLIWGRHIGATSWIFQTQKSSHTASAYKYIYLYLYIYIYVEGCAVFDLFTFWQFNPIRPPKPQHQLFSNPFR